LREENRQSYASMDVGGGGGETGRALLEIIGPEFKRTGVEARRLKGGVKKRGGGRGASEKNRENTTKTMRRKKRKMESNLLQQQKRSGKGKKKSYNDLAGKRPSHEFFQ